MDQIPDDMVLEILRFGTRREMSSINYNTRNAVLKLEMEVIKDIKPKYGSLENVIREGTLPQIEVAFRHLDEWKPLNPQKIAYESARRGLKMKVQWALENGAKLNIHLAEMAAEGGLFDIVKECVNKGLKALPEIAKGAARGGHLDIVKWAVFDISKYRKSGIPRHKNNFNVDVAVEAARAGHLDIFEWIIKKGVDVSMPIVKAVIEGGHLEIVKYVIENRLGSITYIEGLYPRIAAKKGYLDIIEWLGENNHIKFFQNVAKEAARSGYLDIVKYAMERLEPEWWFDVGREGAAEGHLNIVEYAVSRYADPIELLKEVARYATAFKHLNIIDYAMERLEPEWWEKVALVAANEGHLELVKYAIEHGANNFSEIEQEANRFGKSKVVHYMKSLGLV